MQDWGNYTPQMLKMRINPKLRPSVSSDSGSGTIDISCQAEDQACDAQSKEISTEMASSRSATGERSSPSHTPWSRRRRPIFEKRSDGLAKVNEKKAEALTVTTSLSKVEHQWEQELHLIKVDQEKLKLEREKFMLEREKVMLEKEKVMLERERELLRQDKMRREILVQQLNKEL